MTSATVKVCRDCKTPKDAGEYFRHSATADRLQSYCKDCMRIRNQQWKARNPEKLAEYERQRIRRPHHVRRAEQLRREYDLSPEKYGEMVRQQSGQCAICGEVPKAVKGKRVNLVVDHCHKTNKVRGLLCSSCNVALGHMKDDVARLKAAISYLEER